MSLRPYAAALALLVCAACVPEQPQQSERRPVVTATPTASLFDAPIQPTEPIGFSRIVSNIETGRSIGRYRLGWNCAPGAMTWTDGSAVGLNSPEYGSRFVETLSQAGYRVVGGNNRLFDVEAERISARYLVGAQLIDIRQEVCDDRYAGPFGEGHVAIEWQVYSVAERRVVYTTRTQGNARTETGSRDGRAVLTRSAFSDAAATLARDPGFRATVSAQPVSAGPNVAGTTLEIPRYTIFSGPVSARFSQIRAASVTVLTAGGHGSGFFVSDDGLVLTNQHVVGNAEHANVRLAAGMEVVGRVLRRDVIRDVALIKLEIARAPPLPISSVLPTVGNEVYALGSPADPNLGGTLTRGIVSAVRMFSSSGVELPMIQSDASIYGGNSGGPLLDTSGNVIGIAVSSAADGGRPVGGVNFFIPIDDALRYLNIRLGQPRELRF